MTRATPIAVVALVASLGCGAGQYPSALSQRPLNMPSGEHQLVIGGGLRGSADGSAKLGLDLRYRYGLSDQLGIELPLVLSYGGPVADNLELRAQAGLDGVGYGADQTSKYYRVDPRYRFAGHEELYGLFGVAVLGRSVLGPDAALRFGGSSRSYLGAHGFYRPSLIGDATVTYELGPSISVGLGCSFGLSTESPSGVEDRQVGLLYIGSVGNAFSPLVALHVADELDLYGAGHWVYDFGSEIGGWVGTAGIDWHFD